MTHDEKIVEAVARALCRRQIVSNLRWEKEPATPEFIQRCEDAGWQSGEWIDQARAAITAYQAEAWQDISTAPRDGRKIWVYGGRHTNPHLTDADGEWWNSTLCPGSSRPTHWMPTPSTPNPPASP